ncbi:MAG: phosphatase PAP2 family protein [Planctomycetales bacterium]|nr:phosphatase PAP2 family protein [Planctomycetales bacterium]
MNSGSETNRERMLSRGWIIAVHRSRTRFFQAMTWVGRFELTTMVLLAIVAGGTWTFIALADEVFEQDTAAFDRSVLLSLRNPDNPEDPIGPRWVEELGRDMTALGGVGFLVLLTLSVAGYLLLLGKPRMMWFVLVSVFGGLLLGLIFKSVFARPRPDLVTHGSYVYTKSFPSGHSLMAAITYLTLGSLLARIQQLWRLKAYLILLAIGVTLAVGISRVYLGVHWPTDVLAGWTLGAAWAALCGLTARHLQRRGQVEATSTPSREERPLNDSIRNQTSERG